MGAVRTLAIFCDDVRQEIGKKISLIGVYGPNIVFRANPPVTYPRLCIVVWAWGELQDIPTRMELHILAQPGELPLFSGALKRTETTPEDEAGRIARIQTLIELSPLELKQPGRIEVRLDIGSETQVAGRLDVKFEPPETDASAPNEPEQPA